MNTRTLAAGAALLLVGTLGPAAASPPQRTAERGVRRALLRLNALLAQRDPALAGEFVKRDALLVGSSAGEVARGREAIGAHLAQMYALPHTVGFAWREVEVLMRAGLAILHAEGEVVLKGSDGERREPYRLTGVLEPQGGRWKWRLFHGSQPAG